MAGQSKQVLYTPVDIDDADFVDYEHDPKMDEENVEFEKFKSEMHDSQDDAKITVGKKLTDSRGRPIGKQVFECFECGIDDYTFSQLCSRIRDDYGTGLYQIIGRDSKGKYKFKKVVGVQAPITPDNKPNASSDVGSLIDKFSDAMERQQARTEQMFKDLVGPRHGGDAFDQMTKMMSAMGAMMGAVGFKPQAPQPQKTLMEQLTEFKMIKELFGDSSDDSSGEANMWSMLSETMKALGGPIAMAIAAGAKSGALDENGIAQMPQAKALPSPEKPVSSKDAEFMRTQVKILIANAKAGVPAKTFAAIVVENTPEEKADALFDFIAADNYFARIVALVPEAKEHEKWFVALRAEIIELMAEPDDGDDATDDEYVELADGETDLITGLPIAPDGAKVAHNDAVAGVENDSTSDQSHDPDNGNPAKPAKRKRGNKSNA